jgi:hypothetical protein
MPLADPPKHGDPIVDVGFTIGLAWLGGERSGRSRVVAGEVALYTVVDDAAIYLIYPAACVLFQLLQAPADLIEALPPYGFVTPGTDFIFSLRYWLLIILTSAAS